MAQYFWTPDPADLGAQPSNISIVYGDLTLTVKQDGAGDYYLEVAGGVEERKVFTFDSIDGNNLSNVGNVEMWAEYYASADSRIDTRQLCRFSGTTGGDTTSLMFGWEDTDSEQVKLSKIVSGSFGNYANISYSQTHEIKFQTRSQAIDNNQKTKQWDSSVSEPAGWDVEATDSDVTQSGGVGQFQFVSGTFRIYAWSIGTNGDPAPTEPVSGDVLLSGSINTLSTLSGSADAQPALSGPINSISTISGSIVLQQEIAGTMASVSTLSGAIDSQPAISGPITSASSLSASMDAQPGLSGSIDAVSTMTGSLSLLGILLMGGSIDSVSSITGAMEIDMPMGGSIESVSSVSGSLPLEMLLSGSVDTVTQLIGNAVMELEMSGQVAAASQLSGALEVLGNIGFLSVDDVIIELNLLVDQSPELKAVLTAASTTTASFTIDGIDIKPQ